MTNFSPVSAEATASASLSYSETRLSNGALYWLERRPSEGGRTTIMCHSDETTREILPARYNCRSRVHEYGGGAYCVTSDTVYFIEDSDQQIYRFRDGIAVRITDAKDMRFTDLEADPLHNRLFAVCESLREAGHPVSSLATIAIDTGTISNIASGRDFYSSPRYHDGSLAWLSWDFPDMPWDNTVLSITEIDESGAVISQREHAGGIDESICQPEWHDGTLYYVSDRNGWWNLYRMTESGDVAIHPDDAEYAVPHWVFAQRQYAFVGDKLIAARNSNGRSNLLAIDLVTLQVQTLDTGHEHFEYITADDDQCAMIASSWNKPASILRLEKNNVTVLQSLPLPVPEAHISRPETLLLKSRSGDDIHAFYYPPVIPQTSPPALIVIGHGGPTGQSNTSFELRKQYWTGRGFALLDVNYSGSTGYGREYRDRLYDNWGKLDVTDLCDAAQSVCEQGLADPERLIIKGSSAGGYTVLAALCFEDVFKAGASYYGISDLETLADDTHKFEARYLDKLVGPYPERKDLYLERSPIHHPDGFDRPVIFLQGEEDRVVPREQAEVMVDALREKGIPVAYRLYEGEQHGFRQAATIIDALESEYCFYRRIFGIEADCELEISNAQ